MLVISTSNVRTLNEHSYEVTSSASSVLSFAVD